MDSSTHQRFEQSQYEWFVKLWAVFGIGLFLATWKLWTPQTEFPQIPFFGFLVATPGWIDWLALGIAIAGLTGCVALQLPRDKNLTKSLITTQAASGVFAISMMVLISLNQQRLQPWAYQFLFFATLIWRCKREQALPAMRWIVISIYVYSALSKLDYQFVHTVGDQMLSTLTGLIGVDSSKWPAEVKSFLVLMFPTAELLIGVGLSIHSTRRLATFAAVSMHVALLLILGPTGLNHQYGVLVWNLFFVVQAILLFGLQTSAKGSARKTTGKNQANHINSFAKFITLFVVGFPMTQWVGICDHWPAWQVYSPSSSRAKLINERSLGAWSIEALGVPIYPQGRFQFAVAVAIAKKQELDRPQIELQDQSNRFSGERNTVSLSRADQLARKADSFWLNTKARDLWYEN